MRVTLSALVGSLLAIGSASAQTTAADHTQARAGNANVVAPWARPALTAKESPGYVGGGKLFGGEARGPIDGTFGYDYVGHGWKPGRVFLSYHPNLGGKPTGPYRTDGPRVFDIFSIRPVRKALHEEGH